MSVKLRKGRDNFIEEANIKHNYKYSYDKVPDSFKVRSKVTIICPIHGDFKQTAYSHKRGCGCPYCSGKLSQDPDKNIKLRTNKINYLIKKYQLDHVRLVELSSEYKGKYKFYCDIHGELSKNISQVYQGHICGGCIKLKNRKILTENELNKMLKQHNNKFEYIDYIDLVGQKTKMTIRCKEHDHIFECSKSTHTLTKFAGCVYCFKQYKDFGAKELEEVIDGFRKIHGDRYGYDKVDYLGSTVKVLITCYKHGDFLQNTGSHLNGSGCPKCKHSMGEKLIQNILNKMGIHYTTQKTFYGCINDETNRMLPFDIYVPEFHTCIEFDGYQHFIPIERWGGGDNLKEIQKRDYIKNTYCKDNDINLIRLNYTMDKIQIVDTLNKSFDKNLIVEIKKRTKWIDINIIERVKDYKTREEFRINDNTLWDYCYRNKLLDSVCEHMKPKKNRYTYDSAKEICKQYTDYTLFEKERGGLITYVRKNKLFELVEHMDKKKVFRSNEEIINELKKYECKMDVRKKNSQLYVVALRRGLINVVKGKTILWTEQMVRDVFKKCQTKNEVKTQYRGAENYAKKHGIYKELTSHFIKKSQ
jgi:hypothetical protein